MKLLFEQGAPGRRTFCFPKSEMNGHAVPDHLKRGITPRLPQMSEVEISRHYTRLSKQAFGVNSGF